MTGAINFKCKIAYNTLAEARAAGYRETRETALQVGYIKKNTDYEQAPVYIAGKGRQAGKLFYLMPAQNSTRYCMRVYLEKRGAVE